MSTQRSVAKDFHNLMRNIASFSGGQARVVKWDDDNLEEFEVEIAPTDGLYKNGKFIFKFQAVAYSEEHPTIHCLTKIYHPNIDPTVDNTEEVNICVSLLEEWEEINDLEDCVQAILFLFYNPNLDDPLSPYFGSGMSYEDFQQNVRVSLQGGEVDDFTFETNYGYIENGIVEKNVSGNKSSDQIKDKLSGNVDSNVAAIVSKDEEATKSSDLVQDITNNTPQTESKPLLSSETQTESKSPSRKENLLLPANSKVWNLSFDYLVPFNTLVSVMFRHFLKKFGKPR